MTEPVTWGSDVPVSLPQPLDESNPGIIPMDGFCFTATGLAWDLSRSDWEAISTPTFAPDAPQDQVIRYDDGL